MSFNLDQFLNVLGTIGPIAMQVAGVPAPIATAVTAGMQLAEHRGQLTGGDSTAKKAWAMSAAQDAMLAMNAAKPGVLTATDQQNILTTVDEGIDTTIAAVNAITKQKGATVPGDMVPPPAA